MTSFSDAWKKATGDPDDFDPPDGYHTAKLVDAGAFTARTSSRDKVKLTWQILGTANAGRQFVDFNDIDESNPTGIRIVAEKLTLLGLPADFEPDDIEDLDHAVFNLIGAIADITVKHKDGWLNVYVNSVRVEQSDIPTTIERQAQPQANGTAPAAIDDDIPF